MKYKGPLELRVDNKIILQMHVVSVNFVIGTLFFENQF